MDQDNEIHVRQKRDYGCIWFAHLPPDLTMRLETLPLETPVRLLINDQETLWKRMRPGNGRPTRGLRIVSGKASWSTIKVGDNFTLQTVRAGVQVEPLQTPLAMSATGEANNHSPSSECAGSAMFGAYLFIDYSGAENVSQQGKAIRIAYGEGLDRARLIEERYHRATLVDFIVKCLRSASRRGIRMCLGQDHALGIPIGLARELGISHMPWRTALDSFLDGTYDPTAPALRQLGEFAFRLNRWLVEQGRKDYFWSATKAQKYQVPGLDPRKGETDGSAYRLTDRCRSQSGRGSPKPFNRLGDPGSVGGQLYLVW